MTTAAPAHPASPAAAPRLSRWDRFIPLAPAARTTPLDRALAAFDPSAPAPAFALADLRSDLAARCAYWRVGPDFPPLPRDQALLAHPGAPSQTWQALFVPCVVLLGALMTFGAHFSLWVFAFTIVFFAAAFLIRHFHRIDRWWMRRTIADRICPDCAYDLSSLPDALPAEALAHIRVGPAHCPECGVPWPLIPPPAPLAGPPRAGGQQA